MTLGSPVALIDTTRSCQPGVGVERQTFRVAAVDALTPVGKKSILPALALTRKPGESAG